MEQDNFDNLLFKTLVYKALREDKMITGIRLLGSDERIVSIAKMMGGGKPSTAA